MKFVIATLSLLSLSSAFAGCLNANPEIEYTCSIKLQSETLNEDIEQSVKGMVNEVGESVVYFPQSDKSIEVNVHMGQARCNPEIVNTELAVHFYQGEVTDVFMAKRILRFGSNLEVLDAKSVSAYLTYDDSTYSVECKFSEVR